jgi:hypothetical protein
VPGTETSGKKEPVSGMKKKNPVGPLRNTTSCSVISFFKMTRPMSRVLVEKQVFFKMGDRFSRRKQMQTAGM